MPKARLAIAAVVTQGRARAYGVGVPAGGRYRAEVEAVCEPRSRRPKASSSAISPDVVQPIMRLRKELAEQGLDADPRTIARHLDHDRQTRVSVATTGRTDPAWPGHPEPAMRPFVQPAVQKPTCPTNAGRPTSPTPSWRTGPASSSDVPSIPPAVQEYGVPTVEQPGRVEPPKYSLPRRARHRKGRRCM